MNNKIKDVLNTGKKKAVVAALCGALTIVLGTGVVFAANNANENEKMLMRVDNGVKTYSTDEGKTWNQGTPEGFKETINKDGSSTAIVGNPPDDGAAGMMVQNKNGVMSYSTDGGKTWSEKAPDGVTTSVNEDGSVSVKSK